MEKIKILICPSDVMGVGHFRSIWPAQAIKKNFRDEIEVEINTNANITNIEYLKKFDIIHFHRVLGPYEKMSEVSKTLSEAGVVLIMDIDDYWDPPTTHPLYELVKKDNITEKILNNLNNAHYITTTTNVFKRHIQKYNTNVEVIPNALNMQHPMWNGVTEPDSKDRARITWIGGSSHLHDLKLLESSFNMLVADVNLRDKFQITMCGFDTRGTITEITQNGQRKTRKIKPHETVWNDFERIFTSNYTLIKDEKYKKWLLKVKKEQYPSQEEQSYIRRWTLPLTQYGNHYNYCDICLAPLLEHERYKKLKGGEIVADTDQRPGTIMTKPHYFNEVKSELKIIEAGMMNKVLIAQDFGVYKDLLKHGETGLLVEDNKQGWYKAMKSVITDKGLRKSLAENLHEFVKDKYELQNVTAQRVEFYKRVMQEKKDNKLSIPRKNKEVLLDIFSNKNTNQKVVKSIIRK